MSTDQLHEMFAEIARIQKQTAEASRETDQRFKETDRKIKELANLFTNQWGKLVEALLGSGLPELFKARGIQVTEAGRDFEFLDEMGRKTAQVDVMVRNGDEDVAVEVKTTCRPGDVTEHIERLARVRAAKPEYREGRKKLYGAVAALKFDAEADKLAEKQGLFVLKCGEGAVAIVNSPDFRPKSF